MIAEGARDGLPKQAFPPSLPAATTTGMPASVAAATAASSASDGSPPRLMLITEGPTGLCWTTQSSAAITSVVLPEPLQSSTRTGVSVTPLATPYVRPPTVPATCVP